MTTGHFMGKRIMMIHVSKTSDTPVVISCTSYRELQGLGGVLEVGSAAYELPQIGERQTVTVDADDIADVPVGAVRGSFTVGDTSGGIVCKTLIDFQVLDGVVSVGGEVACIVPVIPIGDSPKWPTAISKAIDDLVDAKTKISKLLLVDECQHEYELSATTEDGAPELKVEQRQAKP